MMLKGLLVLAWRNLWRNHRRTLVMLSAIVLGVWSMVIMSALLRGMIDEMVTGGIENMPGEVQVHHPQFRDDPNVEYSFAFPSGALANALEAPAVKAWTARVKVPAVIASERSSRGVMLLGVDPISEIALGSAPDDLAEGRFLENAADRGVVIGASLARRLETRLGKRVVVMSQDPDNNVAERGMRVVGIYRARLQGTEDTLIYAGRDVVQSMLGIGNQVSELALIGDSYRQVDWYQDIAERAGAELETLPWQQLDDMLAIMLEVQDGIAVFLMVIMFMALSFGLVNTLVMAVYERVREIGLMKALGMAPRLILGQVLLESAILMSIGLAVGNTLAVLTIKPLESGIDISAVAEGMEGMGIGATLYPALQGSDLVTSTVVVLVLGLLASLIPAWRASRFDPITALGKH